MGQLLKEKNLLLEEQILSLKSSLNLRKEALRNLQKLFPLVKMVEEGTDLYHIRMISLGGVYIQLHRLEVYIFNNISQKCLL